MTREIADEGLAIRVESQRRHQKMVLVDRSNPAIETGRGYKERPLYPSRAKNGQYVGVVLFQPVIEREQAEISLGPISPLEKLERRFESGGLETLEDVAHLILEGIRQQPLEP